MFRTIRLIVLSVLFLACAGYALAGDAKGAKDHPMISRYRGSTIVGYRIKKFDEYTLLTGKVVNRGRAPEGSPRLEGRVSMITYETPAERTTLEVFRNYRDELTQAGFDILFECADRDCGGRDFNHTVVDYRRGFAENYKDQRYLAARLSRQAGDVHVSLYVVKNYSSGGPTHDRIYTQLDVVESEPMDTGMVTVDAGAMAGSIEKSGHVALYGIYFDSNKAEVKPESDATLAEIAKLLERDPSLKLFVVGHTDSAGGLDFNTDLSRRRAEAVVDELVRSHGVDAGRLVPRGVAFLAPVASNGTEAGRARNRRVELVKHR